MKYNEIFPGKHNPKFLKYNFNARVRKMLLQLMTDSFNRVCHSSVAYACEVGSDAMIGYGFLVENIKRLHGLENSDLKGDGDYQKVRQYLFKCKDGQVLELISMFYGAVFDGYNDRVKNRRGLISSYYDAGNDAEIINYINNDLPNEINTILRANQLGYVFETKQTDKGMQYQITKMDDDYLYSETVAHAWNYLKNIKEFKNASDEFTKALQYYWGANTDYENAIKEANSAFESVLKVITVKDQNLTSMPNETAVKLIVELVRGGYIDGKLQQAFQALPTFANYKGRHGKGINISSAEEHDAEFAINLSATFIKMLVKKYIGYKSNK